MTSSVFPKHCAFTSGFHHLSTELICYYRYTADFLAMDGSAPALIGQNDESIVCGVRSFGTRLHPETVNCLLIC